MEVPNKLQQQHRLTRRTKKIDPNDWSGAELPKDVTFEERQTNIYKLSRQRKRLSKL
jgi:hypothetical protein